MDVQDAIAAGADSPFVSKGLLPSAELVQQLVAAFLSRRLGLDVLASTSAP